jgi:nucleoside-diphosphate-sugar epimerase
LAAESPKSVGEVINVGCGQRTSVNDLLETLKEITGRTDIQADYQPPRAGDVLHTLADLTRARELLGYEPRTGLQEGLRLTIDWWRQAQGVSEARPSGRAT